MLINEESNDWDDKWNAVIPILQSFTWIPYSFAHEFPADDIFSDSSLINLKSPLLTNALPYFDGHAQIT